MMNSTNRLFLILLIFFSVALTHTKQIQPADDTQPIKTIMQRLMMDMQTIEVGIWNENYETIWSGANNIVEHPKIPMDQRKQIAEILGNQMKAFAAIDRKVHNQADSLAEDAKARDMQEILKHYSIIQKGCVGCHASFRTKIIEGR